MENRYDITRQDIDFEYGENYYRSRPTDEFRFVGKFMRLKTKPWFTDEPKTIFQNFGIPTEQRRAQDLVNLFDGDISCFYYVEAASNNTDEAIKWILGAIATHLNETGKSISNISRIMPADYLKTFIEYMKSNRFPKNFAREIFAEILNAEHYFDLQITDEMTQSEVEFVLAFQGTKRTAAVAMLDNIINDPKYKAVDTSEIDQMIEDVITANPENAIKVLEQPRLAQWFVGQVMKASKGKASAAIVQEKLKLRFGIVD